jgi:hypothetical protein
MLLHLGTDRANRVSTTLSDDTARARCSWKCRYRPLGEVCVTGRYLVICAAIPVVGSTYRRRSVLCHAFRDRSPSTAAKAWACSIAERRTNSAMVFFAISSPWLSFRVR